MFVVTTENCVINLSTSHEIYLDYSDNEWSVLVDYGGTGDDGVIHFFEEKADADDCLQAILKRIGSGQHVFYMDTWLAGR